MNLIPKTSVVTNLKQQSTISHQRENDGFKPILMNYSTQISYDKECANKMREIQRHEKFTPYIIFVKEQFKNESQTGFYTFLKHLLFDKNLY